MNTIDRIFVINLKRRPERLHHFMEECKRERVPLDKVVVWEAVDAMSHSFTEEERKQFHLCNFDIKSETGRGCMANQLSHLQILREICEKGYKKCIIFQDDVRFCQHFVEHVDQVEFPVDGEIVWIGLHLTARGSYFEDFPLDTDTVPEGDYILENVNETVGRLRPTINPASLAYLITLDGAKNYVEEIERNGIRYATDVNYQEYLINKGIQYGTRKVLCTGNHKFKSDIFKYDDDAILREMFEII